LWGWWGNAGIEERGLALEILQDQKHLRVYANKKQRSKEDCVKSNNMKEVATVTIPQDRDEPRLTLRIYRGKAKFYIRIESDYRAIPPFMHMPIRPTNLEDAKSESKMLLHLIRTSFRHISGKTLDLPGHLKQVESEIPAFLGVLESNTFLGQN
jgi:hypothetical protein